MQSLEEMGKIMNNANSVVGEIQYLLVSQLDLDVNNPRFQVEEHEKSQIGLANKLIMGYDVLTVAESMARNGFFANEPLVAILDEENAGKYIVIEGNRRLTALKALCDADFRQNLFEPETWTKLAAGSPMNGDVKVPVTVVSDRSKINPILGYRHISGINGWLPLAQARFIARMIDDEKATFEETADSVGKARAEVIKMYRDQAVVKQAADAGFDIGRIESSFSLVTLAMGSPALREFVSAPLGGDIQVGVDPIPSEKIDDLKEMFGWLFGEGDVPPVIKDSREISKLGKVIQKPLGLDVLRATKNLAEAKAAVDDEGMDPLVRVRLRLKAAANAAVSASEDITEFTSDEQVIALIEELQAAVEDLAVALKTENAGL